MSANNDELRQIVTDALVGMISGVTGLVPPTGPGSIPDFIQAPIDRAVEKIQEGLRFVPAGCEVVPILPTREMVRAAEEAYMPFGDMELAIRLAILSAPGAPAEPARVVSVPLQLLEHAARILKNAHAYQGSARELASEELRSLIRVALREVKS